MELNLLKFEVKDVCFAAQTCWRNGVLYINKNELLNILYEHGYESALVDIVKPGESCRITHVMDAVEPRWKPNRPLAYSGASGTVPYVSGDGKTHVLTGINLLQTGAMPGIQEGLLDMSGPGAAYSHFAKNINIVLQGKSPNSPGPEEYDDMQRTCLFRISDWLAQTTAHAEPDRMESFRWRLADHHEQSLPRVAYVYHIQAQGNLRDTFIYGQSGKQMLPGLMNPLEILDGAVQSGNYVIACQKNPTYIHSNHPVIQELLQRHGRELQFAGVIMANEYSNLTDKIRSANLTVNLLKLIDAKGVIITQEGGGHSDTDVMLVSAKCEEQGIQSTIIINEIAGTHGNMPSLVDFHESAGCMISTGNNDESIELPEVERVVGGNHFDSMPGTDLKGSIRVPLAKIYTATNQLGMSALTAVER